MQHHKYSLTELENMLIVGEGNLCGFTSQPYKRRERKRLEREEKKLKIK